MDTLFGPPPPDGNQDRDSVIYGAYWTFFGLGLLFICLRFYARIKIHALGWDDWTMAFTMVSPAFLTQFPTIGVVPLLTVRVS